MSIELVGVLVYVAAQLLIGFAVSRRVRTEADYLLAGRRLGYPLAIFSIFATWFGAESCIGASGAIYEKGLAGAASDPFGYAICLLLMGLLFAVPLWRQRLTTLADLFRRRYSPGVERLAVLIMVPASLLWAAAQVRAFGQVLTTSSEMEIDVAISIAALVVVVYTVFGGLLADAITDVVQGVVLIAGLFVLMGVVLWHGGGAAATLERIDPQQLRFFGEASLLETLEAWAIPICGSLVAQELIARVLASRSERVARRATLAATAIYLCVGLIPVLIGLVGRATLESVPDSEQVLPLMARRYLGSFAYAIFAGALVSAILSTVDSALLAASSLVSHNLILSLRSNLSESRKLLVARAGVVFFGIVAYVIALHAEGVYQLVKDASAFGSAGIFTIVAMALFGRGLGRVPSAVGALVTGTAVWIWGYIVEFPGAFVASLAAAFAAYLGLAPFGARANLFQATVEPEPRPEPALPSE